MLVHCTNSPYNTPQTNAGTLPPAALAELLWSVGALGRRPGQPWMEAFAVAAASALPDFCADDLARLVWAMAAVREEVSVDGTAGY